MARKSMVIRAQRAPKFSTRRVNRCRICGRPRGYMRKFQVCRICFRELASRGEMPGITKASW
ncbi:MAG: type Z 30S ribosomal protein S14 [Firmicutes bacterium]|nr:type Z 30S ribosomal protein S14 [Bacillota bacterium]